MNGYEFRGVSGHYYDNSFVSGSNHLVNINTKKITLIVKVFDEKSFNNWDYRSRWFLFG